MTANTLQGDCEICLAVGMDDDVVKPTRVDVLIDPLLRTTTNDQSEKT